MHLREMYDIDVELSLSKSTILLQRLKLITPKNIMQILIVQSLITWEHNNSIHTLM